MPIHKVHIRARRTTKGNRSRSLCSQEAHPRHSLVGPQQGYLEKRQRKSYCGPIKEYDQSFEDREHREYTRSSSSSIRLIFQCEHRGYLQASGWYGAYAKSMPGRPSQSENTSQPQRICLAGGASCMAADHPHYAERRNQSV